MNLTQGHALVTYAFRLWLSLRRLLPKQECQAFEGKVGRKSPQIEQIYVINLNREPKRWNKIQRELRHILDSSGSELLNLTVRNVAVDAQDYIENPIRDTKVNPHYTLADQLFVEPQPLTLPTRLELNAPIQMSRAEYAVARSHINVWEQVASGDQEFVLILEDDVWFHSRFAKLMDRTWNDILSMDGRNGNFDILYLSYNEVKNGAPKTVLSKQLFRPKRGLWYLSGYVLSRKGAEKLIQLLPCKGPVDLWINHQFDLLDVLAIKKPVIGQRRDIKSSNSYSILPNLTTIGAINSEGASLYNIRPTEQPVFVFGSKNSGCSSLAMALSMLGYRCCSDLTDLPSSEMERLLEGRENRVFNAYVNIGKLEPKVEELKIRYPNAKFILTADRNEGVDSKFLKLKYQLKGSDLAVLRLDESKKWKIICEHLRCPPPSCSYPVLKDIGQRQIIFGEKIEPNPVSDFIKSKRDKSPWVIESEKWWRGINVGTNNFCINGDGKSVEITDSLEFLNTKHWITRGDTFTDNLALFRSSNVTFIKGIGAKLAVRKESCGVRDYTAASISSQDQYLFGKFEANIQASNVPGVVTGFFLHRNSPRQEIDIEIAGNRPDRLLINVFFNPGGEGAIFDYGYRGSPCYVELGFDASKSSHRYTIEWNPNEIRWYVDGKLVHRRVIWDPTPIPHLPMTLHFNNWITRSTQLAGRINYRNLPAISIIGKISIEANAVIPKLQSNDTNRQSISHKLNSSHFKQ